MEFNFDDLDKLGLEFDNQHKTEREKREEKKRRIEEENRERAEREAAQKAEEEAKEAVRVAEAKTEGDERAGATEGNKIDGQSGNADSKGEENETSNPDEDENNEEENTEDEDEGDGEPDAENGHFAEFYFGTPKPNGEYSNKQMSQRNKRALDALLDTPIPNTIGTDPISTKKQCNGKIPLILFVYGIERIIFFWIGANSCSDSGANKKTGIDKMSYLPDSITNQKGWEMAEVDEGVIGGEVEWDLKGMENADSIMSRNRMSSEELDRIVKSIATRTWGKQKVDPEDISEVLNKLEAGQRSKESDTKGEVMPELTSEEQDLRKYVIKPGQCPITYDDVIMDSVTKTTVKQFVALSKLKVNKNSSPLFSYFKSPTLSAAELNGRYVGETEKAISAMFSLARKLHPCILFPDEVDSLFYRRASNNKSWERSALAQYLQEMDGIAAENGSNKAPLVVVATN
ncbi:hypothetical protein TWF703_009752 [Orbilia oligospora]|uniref:ATPase AAA-type core domain-containing protein n=1 Tax=Orbilia oligospora TaxID=2813651 RepID=A0A7C8JJE8_ORBOL|nr:hypothetical protein TWF703_009752 [Orbilia oligospora]